MTGTGQTQACKRSTAVKIPRGGVYSERHVHPCGKRPRPTGRDIILDIHAASPLANKLLAALPHADSSSLFALFTIVPMAQGTVLINVDDEVDQVFFPLSGMISLLVLLKNGTAIETACVGREGVVGAMAGLGLHRSRVRAAVQLAGAFARIPAPQFRKATANSAAISNLCIRYNEALLTEARVTAACNLSHSVEARFCRWLLQSRDHAESDTVPLTQEFLSQMRSEEHTSELQSQSNLVCRLLLEKKKKKIYLFDI